MLSKEQQQVKRLEGDVKSLYWEFKRLLLNEEGGRTVFEDRRNHDRCMDVLERMRHKIETAYTINQQKQK